LPGSNTRVPTADIWSIAIVICALIQRTTFGFAAHLQPEAISGTDWMAGLPVGKLTVASVSWLDSGAGCLSVIGSERQTMSNWKILTMATAEAHGGVCTYQPPSLQQLSIILLGGILASGGIL